MIQKSNSKRFQMYCLLMIMICVITVRVISLAASDNFHGIAAGKVIEAQRLLELPDKIYTWVVPAHGPIHLYILAMLIKIFGNITIVPRLVSLVFGILLPLVYYAFLKEILEEEAALIGAFIIAFFPVHVIHSVLSTAEVTFLFFLFAGLLFFMRYLNTHNLKSLLKAGILLGIASMCRFEGGLFIMILACFLLRRWKHLLIFLGVSAILPIAWMYGNYLYSGGDFLYFLHSSDMVVKAEFKELKSLGMSTSILKKFTYWPLQIVQYFGWPIALIGTMGFVIRGGRSEYRKISILFIFLSCFFIAKTVNEELWFQPRYGMSLGLLFVPYFCLGFLNILNNLKTNLKKTIVVGVLFLYVIVRSCYGIALGLPHTPEWLKSAGIFLNTNVKKGELVYLHSTDHNCREPLRLYSELGHNCFIDHCMLFYPDDLSAKLRQGKLKYMVIVAAAEMNDLREVFRAGNCKIYEARRIASQEKTYD